MQLFYTTEFKGNHAVLDPGDSKHLIRVLRMNKGDEVRLTDGKGNMFSGRIETADPKKCMIALTDKISDFGKRNYRLHMAVAPTKNISRFEWFLEKATEIGVDEITPVICEHSERRIVKTERMQRILIAAMKQSLKAFLPKINEAVSLQKFFHNDTVDMRFIAFIDDSVKSHLTELYEKEKDCIILVGPEGDFSREEFEQAKENGFVPISLGKSRLRTETAAVVACHSVNLINEQL
ncbi:MAG: 16S rRNA (uracil(1498)-N(3))-methyltransferase [Bacteroidales bacterium]|nr:16S rRNA (uracil(1498)-N(3))-methyltransferase [Bacteroidales bacterium]MCF8344641.1 16S rRNA (uracil(1498)-N(3))-methyltransferase [Bacteroidales bacterium]MCF8349559.1 16S rRNA (uracil(1498)-N(3))-methyltransferase [Bacteroidales bacterium]MCF8375118.1 16S rRNA (uracil(1498)-N(3))-methyltransferase [Bacteroidales bacterium]MCF8400025.1 16S rRNA (uracil(1498)-N(3))-methyltransferase [Bacteroidales bacterium]